MINNNETNNKTPEHIKKLIDDNFNGTAKNPIDAKTVNADIEKRFTYKNPTLDQICAMNIVRHKGKELAMLIDQLCPDCREKSLSITNIEDAVMWANSGIVRNRGEIQ